jgi:hypothetical protein
MFIGAHVNYTIQNARFAVQINRIATAAGKEGKVGIGIAGVNGR